MRWHYAKLLSIGFRGRFSYYITIDQQLTIALKKSGYILIISGYI